MEKQVKVMEQVEVKEQAKATRTRKKAKAEQAVKAEAQAEVKQEAVTVEIPVDKITSGKLNIFRFTSYGKFVKTPFFPTLPEKQGYYPYEHHLDAEALDKLGEMYKDKGYKFFSYENRSKYEEFANLSINGFAEYIQYELYRLISSGELERTVEQDGKQVTVRMKWNGKPLEAKQWATVKVKPKAEKKQKVDVDLSELNFFE